MNTVRRLAKLGLLVVVGAYLAGCCAPPYGWGHGGHGGDRGGYGERGGGGYGGRH